MSDHETATTIRHWVTNKAHSAFSWPTDGCGYDQHIRFVEHRNKNWSGGTAAEFDQFCLDYADALLAETAKRGD